MKSGIRAGGMPSTWARTLVNSSAFADEQARLAHVWTFLGLVQDALNDGDWFKVTLATRSVFVQRFGSQLKGFENRCAHRFFPLRTSAKGRGPIVCGFHHWRYDRDGLALGIPQCEEIFGAVSRQLNARLNPIDIATCGSLVFGRFPAPGISDTLEQFLGEGFPILRAMTQVIAEPQHLSALVNANWRLSLHITFDDYHGVAVHPSTFGKLGYSRRENMTYARFGLHSAFLGTNSQPLDKIAAACRDGTYRSSRYQIFQIMPNLVVTTFRSDQQFWHCLIQQFVPVAHNRSTMRAWLYPAPFPADHQWHASWTRWFTDPFRKLVVRHYVRQVFREDNEVCERIQEIAHQIDKAPLISALEERIIWFEEAYQELMLTNIASEELNQSAN